MAQPNLNFENSSDKILILLEDEVQVKNCLKRLKKIKGEKLIVALSPFAMYELDRQGLDYELIESYYKPKELYDLGIDNYSTVEELCNFIDSYIQKGFPEMKELGIKPAFFSFFDLKILYDSLTIRLFQLSRLIDFENPDRIIIYQNRRFPFNPEIGVQSLVPNNHESIYSQLLELQGGRVKVVMLPEASAQERFGIDRAETSITQSFKEQVLKCIQNRPVLYEFAVAYKKVGLNAVLNRLKESIPSGDNPVLLYGGGYNWDYCRNDLKNAGIGPVVRVLRDQPRWLNSVSADEEKCLSAVWSELKEDERFRAFFLWGKIDFFPLMEERFRFIVERITPSCLRVYEDAEIIIKEKKIKAIIASTFSRYVGHTIAQVAHNHEITVTTWQHGSNGYFDFPMAFYNDYMNSDLHLVFGEGVAKKYTKQMKCRDTKIIPIGSAALESLQKDESYLKNKINQQKKKNILYVTTTYYQNNLYISFSPPFSDNRLWQVQKTILNRVCGKDNYTVTVKLHPNIRFREPPLCSYTKENELNCTFIREEYRFTDLLPQADIIVIDIPSTTLLQSLTTTKPIFVYTGHLQIDRVALEMLKKRAYCYDNIHTFTSSLDTFLSGKDIGNVDYNNTEFLEYYGMYKFDGKAGERAAKIVKKVIDEGIGSVPT